MDETHKAAVTLLGAQIRVGGTAELAGYTLKLHEARRQTLTHVASDLFSEGGDAVRAEFCAARRRRQSLARHGAMAARAGRSLRAPPASWPT
jgi:hypothetical protein